MFPPGQGATIGVDFMIKTVEIEGEKIKVRIMDLIFWNFAFMIEQVASNKSSLLLTIQIENAQTFQLFTRIIKTENIYKSYQNANQKVCIWRPSDLIKMDVEVQVLLMFRVN
jgi:Ras family